MNKNLDSIFGILDKISDGAYVVDCKQKNLWNKSWEYFRKAPAK